MSSIYKKKVLGYFLIILSAISFLVCLFNMLLSVITLTQFDFLSNYGLVFFGYSSFVLGERYKNSGQVETLNMLVVTVGLSGVLILFGVSLILIEIVKIIK